MKILIFNATKPLAIGGVNRYAEELIAILKSRGLETDSIIGTDNGGSTIVRLTRLSIDFLRICSGQNIIHIITQSPFNLPYMVLAKLLGKKIVVTYHGDYREEIPFVKEPVLFLLHFISDSTTRILANKIIFPTKYLAVKMKLDCKKKTRIIPNPIRNFNYQTVTTNMHMPMNVEPDRIILVTSSNFNIWQKCEPIKLLLKAVETVAREYPITLLVFGDGIYLKKISDYSNSQSNTIFFMGFNKEFPKYLQSADAFVYISGLDNLPYSVIEAMKAGRVILCNDVGGILENMQRADSYVVELNLDSIINGLRLLIRDFLYNNDEFRMKGQRNRRLVLKELGTEIITNKYLDLYIHMTGRS